MKFTALFLLFASSVWAGSCASTMEELRRLLNDPNFEPRWIETGMNDGKPLLVEITDSKQGLFMTFVKTREGLWAKGVAKICQNGKSLSANITKENITVGDAAPWIMKSALEDGEEFILNYRPRNLEISTTGIFGWSSSFVPNPQK